MPPKNKQHQTKSPLHPRNKHRERYDFNALSTTSPELAEYITENQYGNTSIDFFDDAAVKALNKALLLHYYGISYWELPEGYLCPSVPGRADYIHHIANLLGDSNGGKVPTGNKITCLDIGIGANCVYPIIGNSEYGWSFIGSDIDAEVLANAQQIVESNPNLKKTTELRLQENPTDIFRGIIRSDEYIDITICNPPFHASLEEAKAGTLRKLGNLKKEKVTTPELNFGGTGKELWTEGGEKQFILNMIRQSAHFMSSCFWFSTLVSKQATLAPINKTLESIGAQEQKTIQMGQGNKTSRVVAWTFLGEKEQEAWRKYRWGSRI